MCVCVRSIIWSLQSSPGQWTWGRWVSPRLLFRGGRLQHAKWSCESPSHHGGRGGSRPFVFCSIAIDAYSAERKFWSPSWGEGPICAEYQPANSTCASDLTNSLSFIRRQGRRTRCVWLKWGIHFVTCGLTASFQIAYV